MNTERILVKTAHFTGIETGCQYKWQPVSFHFFGLNSLIVSQGTNGTEYPPESRVVFGKLFLSEAQSAGDNLVLYRKMDCRCWRDFKEGMPAAVTLVPTRLRDRRLCRDAREASPLSLIRVLVKSRTVSA